MRSLVLCLLFGGSLLAQDLGFFVHDPTGANPDTPIPSSYDFADTAQGSASSFVLRIYNPSQVPVLVAAVGVDTPGSNTASPNFSITGLAIGKTLSPLSANFEDVTVNFTPTSTGAISGALNVVYEAQQNGCSLTSANAATQCTPVTISPSVLAGNATAPVITLSYTGAPGLVALQPDSASPMNFGSVATSSSSAVAFTLTNQSAQTAVVPPVSLNTQQYASSAFSLSASGLPATLAAGATATFTVAFAPGQIGLASATIMVGSNSYPIEGTGAALTAFDALQVSYIDQTGVRGLPQAATPIDFGQITAGTSGAATLTFTVTNPATSFNAVTVPNLGVTGSSFALASPPALPDTLAPGQSLTFQVVFSANGTGAYTGTLAIGARTFSLRGESVSLPIPSASFQVDQNPLTSQQQAHLTIQLASASTIAAIGQLTLQFVPSVANVADDPAVIFLASNSRSLSVNVALGAQTATYNGQTSLTFQTGTTAGTITFTLTFPNHAPFTQSFTLSPAAIKLTSVSATWQSPNLVVNLDGYDNTYSAGQMSFTFYDPSGKVIAPGAIALNETSAFHQYFFTNDQAGGAFALQAVFPVLNGDVTQVGSVALTIDNSSGQTSANATF